MKYFDIAVRGFLAWSTGLFFYMIAMMMTVYDGVLSMIFQPIMGGIMTGIAMILIALLGLPLLIKKVWAWWDRFKWISIILISVGVLLMIMSWYPFKMTVIDFETQRSVESFQPALALAGWFSVMFGIFYCPFISVQPVATKMKAWIDTLTL